MDDHHDPVELPITDELDLHAFAPRDAEAVVVDYIESAAAKGFRVIRIVHGRGRGVLRGQVQAVIDRHPLVLEFWDDPRSHLGATIVRLRREDG